MSKKRIVTIEVEVEPGERFESIIEEIWHRLTGSNFLLRNLTGVLYRIDGQRWDMVEMRYR